ncbi:hypothetical protein ACJX0J_031590, partial [Zea mays]
MHSDQGQVLYFISKIIEFLLHYSLLLVIRDHDVGESSRELEVNGQHHKKQQVPCFLIFFLSLRYKFAQNSDGKDNRPNILKLSSFLPAAHKKGADVIHIHQNIK